jgi:hypothetical protein
VVWDQVARFSAALRQEVMVQPPNERQFHVGRIFILILAQPGGNEVDFEVLRIRRGNFPSLEPGFDFSRMVSRLIG